MTTNTETRRAKPAPSLIHNWTSLAGLVLAVSSFFAIACLVALDLFRGFRNPYMGILTYVVAPVFLTSGIFLIVVGALRERRRRRRLQPGVIPMFPLLDLNVPRQRHAFIAAALITVVFLMSTAVGSYWTYEFTESVTFCGKLCHSIMTPEYTTYLESPHARVACVQCHIGPGASWFVKSKLSGAYQVYATLVNQYPRPIPTPIENLRPARETCEQCHWPRKFFGSTERTFDLYLSNEQNSRRTIQMLLKVGGGDPSFGLVGGIHWHMAIANKIEYISSDTKRQSIAWVRLTDQKGNVTVYRSLDSPMTPEQIAAAQPRVMDCIDCHNRPTHIYHPPGHSVDLALQTERIDHTIPHIKEQAVLALTRRYNTTSEAESDIAQTLRAFYQSNHLAFASTHEDLIAQAITETQRIYTRNFFPSMNVDWRVYPDNIGHLRFPGCFRCHEGNHSSTDGKTISHDCNTCHSLIAQGPAGKLETELAGLDFKHPVDISGLWQQVACSNCHATPSTE